MANTNIITMLASIAGLKKDYKDDWTETTKVDWKDTWALAIPINVTLPAITGTLTVGSVLTCSTGTWSRTPTSYTYAWAHSSAPTVVLGTASTYTLVTGDSTFDMICTVVAINAVGSSAPAVAGPTAAVA